MRPAAVLLTGLCALVAAIAPTAASAKPGHVVFPGSRQSSFSLPGTNGYTITVTATDGYIGLSASGKDGLAEYLIKAHRPPGRKISVAFPGRGRVAVEFHPSQAPRHTPPFFPHCHGGETTSQRGVFKGTIEFEGEGGFTEVTAVQARGSIESTSRKTCPRDDHDGSTDFDTDAEATPGYSLGAVQRSPGRELAFTAFRSTADSLLRGNTWFSATLIERQRGQVILRTNIANAAAADFAIAGPPRKPTSATVTPPAPFRGSAAFAGDGRAGTWEGELQIDLPGAPDLELTGPSFRSSLCLNENCVGTPPRR